MRKDDIIKNPIVSYDLAVKLKSKGFPQTDIECFYFYTKPRSKMFGIDEHGYTYPRRNFPKRLYTIGEDLANKLENTFLATSMPIVERWLREKHNIYIASHPCFNDGNRTSKPDYFQVMCIRRGTTKYVTSNADIDAAMEDVVMHALDLIKPRKTSQK